LIRLSTVNGSTAAIMRATGCHRQACRSPILNAPQDEQRLIYSLALGTGLRLAKIVGLDVGDVFAPDGTPRVRVRVRAAIAKGGRAADVFLPDRLVAKLKRFWRWKRERGESLDADTALFCNQSRHRFSKRRVQLAWATWQRRAGFDRVYGFHCLRHSAILSVYRMTHDLYLAQRLSRHVSPAPQTTRSSKLEPNWLAAGEPSGRKPIPSSAWANPARLESR
jgi:integrase/recombinase XerC